MTPELNDLINVAITNKNWLLLAVAILLVLVPTVLHLLGKDMPIVTTLLTAVADFLKARPSLTAPKSEDQKGVLSVVKVEEEKKGPNP